MVQVTDQDRREVARRLRDTAPGDWYLAISVWEIVQDACGIIGMKTNREKLDRLADLIEPSCDRDALLELADEMENNTWYESSFDHRAVTRFARRIRGVLEVKHD